MRASACLTAEKMFAFCKTFTHGKSVPIQGKSSHTTLHFGQNVDTLNFITSHLTRKTPMTNLYMCSENQKVIANLGIFIAWAFITSKYNSTKSYVGNGCNE